MGIRAVAPKGMAKDDWAILRALSATVGRVLPFDSQSELRDQMVEKHPSFGAMGYAPGSMGEGRMDVSSLGTDGELSDAPLTSPVTDFYMTNPIARASNVMAECSAVLEDKIFSEAAE